MWCGATNWSPLIQARARAQRASATVIGYRVETDQQERDGETIVADLHRAVFRYRDASGAEREALSRIATNPPLHAAGSQVAILYDPAYPADAVPEHATVGQAGRVVKVGLFVCFERNELRGVAAR